MRTQRHINHDGLLELEVLALECACGILDKEDMQLMAAFAALCFQCWGS